MPAANYWVRVMPHILILEDESSIAESLLFVLQSESFSAHWVTLATQALSYVKEQAVDLIIMDVGLPDMSGFEACKQLRKFSEVPVMFLTARGDELDRVIGLEIGADDYVVKPFSPREVAARVKAILKRMRPVVPVNDSLFEDATAMTLDRPPEFVIDVERKTIHYHQQLLLLTRFEFCLLQALIEQPGRVFSRDQLLTAVGVSAEAGYDRSIDGHIKTLRAKLRAVNAVAEPIKTQRGFGYSYQPEVI
jgi:two-component system, OmpR family, catabolic regulation response regulator CreB